MVLHNEEKCPGEVVKIVSGEIKARVIFKGCRTPLGLHTEIKLGRSLFKVLSHTWHIINTRCILPCLLCIIKLKSCNLLFSPRSKWYTQFLEWKSSGSAPRKQTKFGTSPSKKWLHHQSYWHVAEEQGQGLSFLEKISRTYFHSQKYFRISFVFCWSIHLVHWKCVMCHVWDNLVEIHNLDKTLIFTMQIMILCNELAFALATTLYSSFNNNSL